MSGFEKIQMGMKLITEGCREAECGTCNSCPFENFCNVLTDSWGLYAPYNWDKEE